jgi:DNA-binding MarR family transcriptional regulator
MLGAVNRLEAPTLGELAAAERVQPPTMSRLVAGMEEAGLLIRLSDTADRRVSRFRLSGDGRRMLFKIRSLKTAFLTRRLALLTEEERSTLHRAAAILQRMTEDA